MSLAMTLSDLYSAGRCVMLLTHYMCSRPTSLLPINDLVCLQ